MPSLREQRFLFVQMFGRLFDSRFRYRLGVGGDSKRLPNLAEFCSFQIALLAQFCSFNLCALRPLGGLDQP
jgi:hypothetical protein